jgi:hypothetical protein
MPLVASLIKITALSLALLCVDMKSMNASADTAGNSTSWRSKCRIYFGCPPSTPLAASIANIERSSH